MKVISVTVLYNPGIEVYNNFLSYYSKVDKAIVFDNSDVPLEEITSKFKELPECIYISYGVNTGIAKALNIAVEKACDLGFEWMLLMDQDSYFDTNQLEKYLLCLRNLLVCNDFGVIGPSVEKKLYSEVSECQVHDAPHVITSGSLISLKACKKIGLFDEKLFIDEVDTDFCYRLRLNNFRVLMLRSVLMNHALGKNLIVRNWHVGPKVERNIHQPIRIYYIVRNFLYTYNQYKKYFPQEMRANKKVTINRVKNSFLYSGQGFKVIYFTIKGIRDYYRDEFGKLKIKK